MRKSDYSSTPHLVVSLVILLTVFNSPSYPADEPIGNESSISTADPRVQENSVSNSGPYMFSDIYIYSGSNFEGSTNSFRGYDPGLDLYDSINLSQTISPYSTLNFVWDFYHNPHTALSKLNKYWWSNPVDMTAKDYPEACDEKQLKEPAEFIGKELGESSFGFYLLTEVPAAADNSANG
jgi:hypothetical protein